MTPTPAIDAFRFGFGFRVLGDCRQPRRLVDADAALAAYAACDDRAELGRESYLSAFRFDAGFAEHLKRTASTKDYAGPCWAAFIWWDVDRDGDIPGALGAARQLAVVLTDSLGVAEDDVLAFLSGGKGFHVGIPSAVIAGGDTAGGGRATSCGCAPSLDFHRIARRFAEAVAERAGVTIDAGVYDRVRCWRAPNSRHPRTGLHKRRLTVDELMHLSADRIAQLAERPAPFELPSPTYRSDAAGRLWTEASEHVRREAEAIAARRTDRNGAARLNRSTLDYIRTGASEGDRHRLCYSAAANLAELGAPLPLCVALLTDAALDCGLPPADVRRAIENGWASVQAGSGDSPQGGAG